MALTNVQNPTHMNSLDFCKSGTIPLLWGQEASGEFTKGILFERTYRKL